MNPATSMTAIARVTTVRSVESTNNSDASVIPVAARATLDLFASVCDRAAEVVRANTNWSASGLRSGQYAIDLDVDDVCVQPLRGAGFDVLSEESGLQQQGDELGRDVVVVDPLDGSSNASLGLPWCATAMCLVSDGVPSVAMVSNLATGDRYTAVRGRGAKQNGRPISVGPRSSLSESIIAVNGLPPEHWGWQQYRALGAAALDIAAVARGGFGGYVDTTTDSHGVWDYLASILILEEAGGCAVDALGRNLTVLNHLERRTPVAASSESLLSELIAARMRRGL
jgi:fructose-1,6-bisphosphatase/inositol monophosphatase family enzyme